ncbi:MAG: hypothetical protein ACFFAL_02840 [Promethearchaeota archaeon]
MERKYLLIIGGIVVAIVLVAIGVIWLGYANETLDVLAHMWGAPEWNFWIPPFPDYEIPGFEGIMFSNFLLGILFVVVILVATFGLMRLLVRLRSKNGQELE